jgi:hypothetical protein
VRRDLREIRGEENPCMLWRLKLREIYVKIKFICRVTKHDTLVVNLYTVLTHQYLHSLLYTQLSIVKNPEQSL